MKEIYIELNGEKINKSIFSQALKAVSIDRKEEKYYIKAEDKDLSLLSSFSNDINILNDKDKTFKYHILNVEPDSKKITFNVYKSFNKKFVLVTATNNDFKDFFALNNIYKENIYIFELDKNIQNNDDIINNPFYKGEKKIEDVFYDDTHIVLVSKEFLTLFNSFILSISNYFLKRYEIKNKSKNGFFSNINKMLFSFGNSNKDENIETLFDDLASKYQIDYKDGKFYLILKNDNSVLSLMLALRFFLSLIDNKIDFTPIKRK